MNSTGTGVAPVRVPELPVRKNGSLVVGGWFSLAFAVFQLSAIFWPPSAIKWFGGPAEMSQTRPVAYALLCIVCGLFAAAFGVYALSGAGKIKKLPLLRTGLIIVTAVYLLRGVLLFMQFPFLIKNPELWRFGLFSAIALVVGLVHLAGVVRLFENGRSEPASKA